MRISSHRLAWTAAAACLWALAAGVASAQTPSCQVTYTKSWEGGNGFGANIIITNNGPAITNGWTLIWLGMLCAPSVDKIKTCCCNTVRRKVFCRCASNYNSRWPNWKSLPRRIKSSRHPASRKHWIWSRVITYCPATQFLSMIPHGS